MLWVKSNALNRYPPLHPAQEGVTDPQWQGEGAVGEFTVQVNYYTTEHEEKKREVLLE